ncbi:diadenosine tetraphosphate (Ap4A) HIT family hydrolase [Rhizobium sp. SG_E_25_P2]|uniref:HIT family protein n=1 Tax=Rhizobium sp. SG_E_25_P2 TaxID=2879942 RepID=UPI00247505BF|nr:HIT family protein [Rhizobium sp. SG_E_25_P2]MDH6264770.1 diadenosine tetraphosphate (Ap4A) HIT family hydrolase [Rhizobium sp. SG_E_25_P2]
MAFTLDERLSNDSALIVRIGLCELRLMNDRRWPWLILVPQRDGLSELFDLAPLDQAMLTFETNLVGAALKKVTGCEKVNIAAIGNIVRQLHVHVVARSAGDPNWPAPVWGYGTREPYSTEEIDAFANRVLEAI